MHISSRSDSTTARFEQAVPPKQRKNQKVLPVVSDNEARVFAETRFSILATSPHSIWRRSSHDHLARRLLAEGVVPHEDPATPMPEGVDAILVRADYFFDRSAMHLLMERKPSVIVVRTSDALLKPVAVHCAGSDAETWATRLMGDPVDASQLPSSVEIIDTDDLPMVYDYELRKQAHPFIRRIEPTSVSEIERRTFALVYKGVTDIVTKYLYPLPAFHATRLAVRFGISPNVITSASLILVFVVFALFANGNFALGLALGYLMSFLDTLDGKLARVTQTTSQFGARFDHWIDMIHPPFWWLAFWWGASPAVPPTGWNQAALITFFGYVAIRVQEWGFKRRHQVRIHVWRSFDSRFRLITTRRNPNLVILTASLILDDVQMGVFWVAGWMVTSFAIHSARWILAEHERKHSGPLVSWLETP